ncbi:hypothetical protein pb186bvf_007288 [Paramecium bursaria]
MKLKLGLFSDQNQLISDVKKKFNSPQAIKSIANITPPKSSSFYVSKSQNLFHANKSRESYQQFDFQNNETMPKDLGGIKTHLNLIGAQIKTTKTCTPQQLTAWQTRLLKLCNLMIEKPVLYELDSPKNARENILFMELQEEKRNRLKVEEQTNKMISQQEVEIKSLMGRIKALEEQLSKKQ